MVEGIPILAGDFREDLSEEVTYEQRYEWGENQAFQVMATKSAKALMQEYAWQVLGNVRRPVWLKYGEQRDGEETRSET